MVSRPKSIATVVVVFAGVCRFSSTAEEASVISASVASSGTSDSAPTMVVLPTPNPPATRIFADSAGAVSEGRAKASRGLESTQHPFQQFAPRHDGGDRVDAHPS